MKFTQNDVNMDKVHERAKIEASKVNRGNRTPEQLLKDCVQGHVAEQYLMDNYGFTDCDLKYHDLVKDGKIIEVKTSKSPVYLDNQLKRIIEADWNHSDIFIGFLIKDGIYELYISKKIT